MVDFFVERPGAPSGSLGGHGGQCVRSRASRNDRPEPQMVNVANCGGRVPSHISNCPSSTRVVVGRWCVIWLRAMIFDNWVGGLNMCIFIPTLQPISNWQNFPILTAAATLTASNGLALFSIKQVTTLSNLTHTHTELTISAGNLMGFRSVKLDSVYQPVGRTASNCLFLMESYGVPLRISLFGWWRSWDSLAHLPHGLLHRFAQMSVKAGNLLRIPSTIYIHLLLSILIIVYQQQFLFVATWLINHEIGL